MIRVIWIFLLLSSCGNLPITYIQNFSSINNVLIGFPDQEITQEIFDDYEYSFIKARFGKGPISILILAYEEDGIYQWSGLDDVSIYTFNGRVIKTIGLESNFEITSPKPRLLSETETRYESINLYGPDLYQASLLSTFSESPKSITRFGSKVNAMRIKETCSIPLINWKKSNYYFRNLDSGLIELTEQSIHPKLPVFKIEFYYKF